MATNNFLTFTNTDTGTNLPTQGDYAVDAQRDIGNQPGVASSKLNNKAIRQSSFITSQLAQFIANTSGLNMLDVDGGEAAILAAMYDALVNRASNALINVGIAASVATSALTVALKTSLGVDASATTPVVLGFRNGTLTTGNFSRVSATAAVSATVPSGATLGTQDGIPANLYLYALNNAGTIELGICNGLLDEGALQTSTALTTGSDSAYVLYSTSARSNVAVRLLGRVSITEATAGTWATGATALALAPFPTAPQQPTTTWVPTCTGFGTVSATSMFFGRSNDRLIGQGSFTIGTPAASTASFTLPSLHIDPNKMAASRIVHVGEMYRVSAGAAYPNVNYGPYPLVYNPADTTKIYFSTAGAGGGGDLFALANGNVVSSTAGESISVNFNVPIAEWA